MANKKEISGKEFLDSVKSTTKQLKKQEQETKMQNLKTKLKTPLTVLATLAAVALLFAFYLWSFEQGVESQKAVTAEINAEVVSQLKQDVKR